VDGPNIELRCNERGAVLAVVQIDIWKSTMTGTGGEHGTTLQQVGAPRRCKQSRPTDLIAHEWRAELTADPPAYFALLTSIFAVMD
jgi:hypothetical protein